MAIISLGLPSLDTKFPLTMTSGVVLIGMQGIGMPPVQNQLTDYALLDGASYQKSRVQTRTIQLQLAAMGTSLSGTGGLHTIRRGLVNAVNPHRTQGLPVTVYYEANTPGRHLDTYYDSGLEMGPVQGYTETLAVRLLAPDPFWYANTQATKGATDAQLGPATRIVSQTKGAWSTMAGGLPGAVYAISKRAAGGVYVGGAFRTAGAVTVQHIGLWTGTKWTTLGGGIAGTKTGSYVTAIREDPTGNVYVGGLFNTAGATAAKNIAKWVIANRAWYAVSTGILGVVRAIDINRQGHVVVAGSFNTAGGVTRKRIALWNGTVWSGLGDLSNHAYAVAITPSNQIIVGGVFNTAGSTKAQHIAYRSSDGIWQKSISTTAFGISGNVYGVALANDAVYAVGAFKTAGGNAALRAARWNGSQWAALGDGVTNTAWAVRVLDSGEVVVGGAFNTAGGHRTGGVAVWNGYDWVNIGATFTNVQAVAESAGVRYYGGTVTGTNTISARTTITNAGTARVYPVIAVYFPTIADMTAHLLMIKNETNGKALYFDYKMIAEETLTIDCRPGHKSVTSSVFGTDLQDCPLPGSDLATFCLEPGANVISFGADNINPPGGCYATFTWNAAYWGAD